jgi:hypothetical protein
MQQPGDVCRRRRWDGIHDGNGHLRPGGAAGVHGFFVAASAVALSKCWAGEGDQDAENRCCVGTVDDDVGAGEPPPKALTSSTSYFGVARLA